jgi:RNA polymerase sigma-70 factor (ECF subfamily)
MECRRPKRRRETSSGDGMSPERDLRLVRARGAGEPDPEALVRRIARGDAGAFEALYDVMGPSVYGVARRVVRDPDRAEDVTQDAFLEVWRKAPSFDDRRGSAKTWLMTIAHRRAVDAVRRNESHKRYDGQATVQEVSHDEPADRLLKDEEHSAVRGCLDTLTELQLESVRLAYFNGYTYAEVATLLAKPLPTIKTRMRDGLIRLRDCLETA